MRYLHVANLTHTLLTLLLLLEQLTLTRHVTTITLGRHVLAHLLHRFAGNNLASDGSLDCNVELLARKEFLEAFAHAASQYYGIVYVDESGECVDALAVEKDIELAKLGCAVLIHFVVKRSITS